MPKPRNPGKAQPKDAGSTPSPRATGEGINTATQRANIEATPAARPRVKHPRRYRQILTFFGRALLSVIVWEVILRTLLGEKRVARGRGERMGRIAHDFRTMAVAMGGVMIKMGQFMSVRVDVLPRAITDELAGLQDEVPPAPMAGIMAVIRQELGAPEAIFSHFETEVRAAASLGQVYAARLANGDRVIVKVQRPGIEDLVATDLAALATVARWVMMWKAVRRRANVPALMDEFARTLWEELDYVAEAENAGRFRELFKDDQTVYVPAPYHEYTTRRVLTLEDVTAIKITDHAAIDAAGVSRKRVAERLLDAYLWMIFDVGFFHADPHPGNLFIYPLSDEEIAEMAPPEEAEAEADERPFYIVFVDFGMTGTITDETRRHLREILVAVGTRDMPRAMRAVQELGVLLPSADLDRLAEVEGFMLDRLWGKTMTEIGQTAFTMKRDLITQFSDLMFEMPFQVPQNFIYLGRAVGVLSGVCTALDPDFNPWEAVLPYVRRLAADELRTEPSFWVQEIGTLLTRMVGLPGQIERVLTRADRGELELRVAPGEILQRDVGRLERALNRATVGVIFAACLIAGTQLYLAGEHIMGMAGYAGAGLALLILALMPRGRA